MFSICDLCDIQYNEILHWKISFQAPRRDVSYKKYFPIQNVILVYITEWKTSSDKNWKFLLAQLVQYSNLIVGCPPTRIYSFNWSLVCFHCNFCVECILCVGIIVYETLSGAPIWVIQGNFQKRKKNESPINFKVLSFYYTLLPSYKVIPFCLAILLINNGIYIQRVPTDERLKEFEKNIVMVSAPTGFCGWML